MLNQLIQQISQSKLLHIDLSLSECGLTPAVHEHPEHILVSLKLPFFVTDAFRLFSAEQQQQFETTAAKPLRWQLECTAEFGARNQAAQLPQIKQVIAVASGKGGVGKSTTTVNLALALQRLGAKVGVLDADIYGPSVPIMLGATEQQPEAVGERQMTPVLAHGLASNSIGYLVPAEDATIWRGPMASAALNQLLNDTQWPELDYLLIDLPPGTGDIQLTLAQKAPLTGAVVVTTPQDLALADAVKGIAMFSKVKVPVTGIVENMSMHTCEKCGHTSPIFGTAGGERLAQQHGVPVLGRLPLDIRIRELADSGQPSVIGEPEGAAANAYMEAAQQLALQLWLDQQSNVAMPNIQISDD